MWTFKKKQRNPADVVPDGPYYRVVYRAIETAEYSKVWVFCSGVDRMRGKLLSKRAENGWIQAEMSNDLGNTWRQCDDMGRPIETEDPEAAA